MSQPQRVATASRLGEENSLTTHAPLSLHVVSPPAQRPSWRERLFHSCAQAVATRVLRKPGALQLRFGLVTDPRGLKAVGATRLRVYGRKVPYLLKELSGDGTDAYDAHSFIFAVWSGDQVVASIRATPYPYETVKYIPEPELAKWLGKGWDTHGIEWGRLLSAAPEGVYRLVPALIFYAGFYMLLMTPYQKCFGYARPQAKRSFDRFLLERDMRSFNIPHRGDHSYLLVKSEFLRVLLHFIPRFLASLVRGALGMSRDSK